MVSFANSLLTAALVVAAMTSSVKADPSFLEAGLFFLTGVEPAEGDVVTERGIVLFREPLVAYLVDGKPCVVRLRNTKNNTVWQMDFCKIAGYRWNSPPAGFNLPSGYIWLGKDDTFCVSWNWDEKKNYTDPDFAKI